MASALTVFRKTGIVHWTEATPCIDGVGLACAKRATTDGTHGLRNQAKVSSTVVRKGGSAHTGFHF